MERQIVRNVAYLGFVTLIAAVSWSERAMATGAYALVPSSAAELFLEDHPFCDGDGSGHDFIADCWTVADCETTYPDFCTDFAEACAQSCAEAECHGTVGTPSWCQGTSGCYGQCSCDCIPG
jgi:hypothetical protein